MDDFSVSKEQKTTEDMRIVIERRKGKVRRKLSKISYLLLNYKLPDRRSGEDRRAK